MPCTSNDQLLGSTGASPLIFHRIVSVIALILGFQSIGAVAQPSKDNREFECAALIDQRTAAWTTNDWSSLERIASRFVKQCAAQLDSEAVADAQSDQAAARAKLNSPKAALAIAEVCIETFYSALGCHVTKIESLTKLGRRTEAQKALNVADKLASHLATKYGEPPSNNSSSVGGELMAAKLNLVHAYQERITELRDGLTE